MAPQTKACSWCGMVKDIRFFAANNGYCLTCDRLVHHRLAYGHYERLMGHQNDACAICGTPMLSDRDLNIDHDHARSTKQVSVVRGILCGNCNKGLGFFKDNPATLRKALEYLETSLARPANNDWINQLPIYRRY